MDYRNRCYFLVRLNPYGSWYDAAHDDYGVEYTTALKFLQKEIKSLKVSAPYNHFVEKVIGSQSHSFSSWVVHNNSIGGYDGNMPGIKYVQMMLSCNLREKETLLSCLDKLKRKNPMSTKYIELTKELCGQ